jgi:two-component system chemotaxis response regulator CheY
LPRSSALTNAHIVFADPAPFARRVIAELFRDSRCGKVDFFQNGAILIEACSTSTPDIVIIDENLPFISGIELLRTLSNLPGFDKNPPDFFLLSDETTKSVVQEAIAGGFRAVIKKPVVPQYLLQAVRECFPNRTISVG